MTVWHVLLYSAAAIFALRSFALLVTNYDQSTIAAELTQLNEGLEIEVGGESDRPIAAEAATAM